MMVNPIMESSEKINKLAKESTSSKMEINMTGSGRMMILRDGESMSMLWAIATRASISKD